MVENKQTEALMLLLSNKTYDNGVLTAGILLCNVNINQISYTVNTSIQFHPNGDVKGGTLLNNVRLHTCFGNTFFKGGRTICFHEDGTVSYGVLNQDAELFSQESPESIGVFEGGNAISFKKNGDVSKYWGTPGGRSFNSNQHLIEDTSDEDDEDGV